MDTKNTRQIRLRAPKTIVEEERYPWALRLTAILTASQDQQPFKTHGNESTHWSIDQYGNNYWLKFDASKRSEFIIGARYDADFLKAFADYLCAKYKLTILPE